MCSTGTSLLYSPPMHIRPTLHPLPSTTEFVARVEDSTTTLTSFRMSRSRRSREPLMPMDRSSLVVIDLALPNTVPESRSIRTESV